MQQLTKIEIESKIELGEALVRLEKNKDFLLVIGKYRDVKEKVNELAYADDDKRKQVIEELVSIANFNIYLESILLKAEEALIYKSTYKEEE
jgi:hypothetical protein